MKKILLALVVLGSFPAIRADENAELKAQRREHARKLYHAIGTGDQVCIDRIMKGSTDSSALQLKAMVDQLEIDGRKTEKSMWLYTQRAVIWVSTSLLMTGLYQYLKSTLYGRAGRPSVASE